MGFLPVRRNFRELQNLKGNNEISGNFSVSMK